MKSKNVSIKDDLDYIEDYKPIKAVKFKKDINKDVKVKRESKQYKY